MIKRLQKPLNIILIIIATFLVVAFIIAPIITGYIAIRPNTSQVGHPPEGFETTTFISSSGNSLVAWYKKPENGAVIIVLHGAGGTRNSMKEVSTMLGKHGYGVLSIDMRGNGESTGKTNLFGWSGTEDVKASIAFLKKQPDVKLIGGIGHSLGGEVLLGAASSCPELDAIVSDGATFRSFKEFYDLDFTSPTIRNISALRVRDLTIHLLSKDTPPNPTLVGSITNSTAKFFFIAAGNVDTEIQYNELFKQKTAERGELWVIPNVSHTAGFSASPSTYENNVTRFFDKNLLSTVSVQ